MLVSAAPLADSQFRAPAWAQTAPLALLLALQLVSPLGYVGGGADDWRYLEAARCVAREGYCTPDTHWAARWPLVAPFAMALLWLGDGVVQAAVAPFLYALVGLAAFQALTARLWGLPVAVLAGAALVATPIFSVPLFQPNVDLPEFALLTASAFLAERGLRTGRTAPLLLAGVCFGAALFARMTGLVLVPAIMLAAVRPEWRRPALLALIGAAGVVALDALVHLAVEGDPLLSWQLASSHTRIPSSELDPAVDLSRSPILNPAFIGGWRPASGIHAHWLVQGPVNLFINPMIGPLLCVGSGLLILRRGEGWRLALVAALIAGAMIYGLAVDPKPRIFLPVAGLMAIVVGRGLVGVWGEGRRAAAAAMLAMLVMTGAVAVSHRFSPAEAVAPVAERWAAEMPGRLAATEFVRSELAFNPIVYELPDHRTRPDLPVLSIEQYGCGARAQRAERLVLPEGGVSVCILASR